MSEYFSGEHVSEISDVLSLSSLIETRIYFCLSWLSITQSKVKCEKVCWKSSVVLLGRTDFYTTQLWVHRDHNLELSEFRIFVKLFELQRLCIQRDFCFRVVGTAIVFEYSIRNRAVDKKCSMVLFWSSSRNFDGYRALDKKSSSR